MANTTKLKTIVEPELKEGFCRDHSCQELSLSGSDIKEIFFDMKPDLIGYDKNNKVLIIGEITVSGYRGRLGKDFHIGATKKLAESFAKFHIIKTEEKKILQEILELDPDYEFDEIECFFIVPEGSRFIKALGYRNKLFETGVMSLAKIPLSEDTKNTVLRVLEESSAEMK